MYKKLTILLIVLFLAVSGYTQAQTAYAFNGGPFSYGTIDLGTGAFTSMGFIPQGSSYYPVSGDNFGVDEQYAIMADFNLSGFYLWHINFSSLTSDSVAQVSPLAAGQTMVKAMSYNDFSDTWYVISGDDFASAAYLYTMDISTGVLTEVGQIQNANSPVTLAIDCGGNAYIVNVEGLMTTTAVLYSLDLSTAAATLIGTNLGFDNVTFGSQDMDYDPANGNLYWSAYWSSGFFDEGGSFRVIDPAAGTSTEIGTFGSFETVTGFSINANCPVPVELSSFTGSVNGTSVNLSWTTATETNNQGFSVERMSSNSSWKQIGFVPGFGTTTKEHSYSFSDNNPGTGSYSYRLLQQDFDGSSVYSEVVNVDVAQPAVFSLNQNYPNPFNPSTKISYSVPEQSFVSIKIYSISGEEVASLINGIQSVGLHQLIFNAKNLSSGIYIARMTAGSFSSIIKMNLLK